jgi:cell wall-associated NlpC family hydrolase
MAIPLHSRPRSQAPGWCNRFIGLPYEDGARGPDKFDCWGIAMLILGERFGVAVPAYEGIGWTRHDQAGRAVTADTIRREALDWDEVTEERAGDIVVLRIMAAPLHVGVVVTPGWMIHGAHDADSALERYDGLFWHNRVDRFVRPRP